MCSPEKSPILKDKSKQRILNSLPKWNKNDGGYFVGLGINTITIHRCRFDSESSLIQDWISTEWTEKGVQFLAYCSHLLCATTFTVALDLQKHDTNNTNMTCSCKDLSLPPVWETNWEEEECSTVLALTSCLHQWRAASLLLLSLGN